MQLKLVEINELDIGQDLSGERAEAKALCDSQRSTNGGDKDLHSDQTTRQLLDSARGRICARQSALYRVERAHLIL